MKKLSVLIGVLLFYTTGFAKVIVLSGLTNVGSANPGQIVEGEVLLQNIGDKEERILIYLNDLVQDCQTATSYAPVGTHPRSSGNWIELNAADRLLAPMEEFSLKYKVKVPEEKNLRGSYWSILMVEIVDPIKEDQLDYGIAMDSKIRYGVQLITNVGAEEPSVIEFAGVELNQKDGGYVLSATAENISEFMVTPTMVLEVYNQDAELVLKTEVPFKKVYPKSCKTFELPIQNLEKGNYDALLVADYGKDLFGTNLEFSID